MAKQPEDNVTAEMFETGEKEIINAAFETYQATLKRRANSENNPAIKALREEEVRKAAKVLNKLQELK